MIEKTKQALRKGYDLIHKAYFEYEGWHGEIDFLIKNKNKKGNYIHFKLKGNGVTVSELEKNEKIDKNLLRFLTVRVKKFDLDKDYFKQENNSSKQVKKKTERIVNDEKKI